MLKRIKLYGIDAPLMIFSYLIIGLGALMFAIFSEDYSGKVWTVGWGALLLFGGIVALHTSLFGKSKIWEKILATHGINSDATVLDMGTGHGLVLIKIARILGQDGHIKGIDLWKKQDQFDNSAKQLEQNIQDAQIVCEVSVDTGDIQALPYADQQFDLITCSFVMHNIKGSDERTKAFVEANRVLKKDGTLILVDTEHKSREYQHTLESLGFEVTTKSEGINGWWTGPWMGSYSMIAKKDK